MLFIGRWFADLGHAHDGNTLAAISQVLTSRRGFDVPRVPEVFVNSVVYMYGSVDAAERGDPVGGCGVLVGVGFEKFPDFCHVYVVTNAHVSDIDRVIRYNTREGL